MTAETNLNNFAYWRINHRIIVWCETCRRWFWHPDGGTIFAGRDFDHVEVGCRCYGEKWALDRGIDAGAAPGRLVADAKASRPKGPAKPDICNCLRSSAAVLDFIAESCSD